MRRALVAAFAVGMLALLWWQWPAQDTPPRQDPRATTTTDSVRRATATTGLQSGSAGSQRQPVAASNSPLTAQADGLWTVQLTGIDPAVPWTAPLQLVFEELCDVRAEVDREGCCRFRPPPRARHPGLQNMRIVTKDDQYRLATAHQRTDALQATGRTTFAVYPVANLRGRVLDPDGNPTASRVRAFAWRDGGPREPLVARTESRPDGTYDLQVPPDTPLLVIADVLAAGFEPWTDLSKPLLAYPPSHSLEQLAFADEQKPRSDVLPATLRAEGTFSIPRDLADLRLGAAAVLHGRVTTSDGMPLRQATVTARPKGLPTDAWHQQLHWSAAHGVVAGAVAQTDALGAFTLHVAAGIGFEVKATATNPVLLAGDAIGTATAPGQLDLVVPGDRITIRVADAGREIRMAWLDLGDRSWRMDASGSFHATLPATSTRVRARHERRLSEWVELSAGARPRVLTLDLQIEDLPVVQLLADSTPAVLEARFQWRPLPTGSAWTLSASRGDASQPFVMHVPAGRYELTVRDVDDSQGGGYLLASRHQIAVTPTGYTKTVPLAFGGRINIDVQDRHGTRLEGTFGLSDATGRDVTPRTIVYDRFVQRLGAPGQLQALSSNQLATVFPPGDYSLVLKIPGHPRIARDVTVTARSRSVVSVRMQ